MAEMIHSRYQVGAEDFPIRHHAADRHAAEVHTVVALLATDQARAITFTAGTVIAERNFQCGIDRL